VLVALITYAVSGVIAPFLAIEAISLALASMGIF
jgi:high-affinity K+ transport system ATPase subunit B